MSKWILDQWGESLDYPSLGFTADPDDILDATAAPDGRWSLNGDQGAAETVTRYTIGGDPSYVEPGDGHYLKWSDGDNAYVPAAPVDLLGDEDFAADLLATYARIAAWAKNPDTLITGALVRNGDGVVTSAAVVWPDGAAGTFTTDTIGTLDTIDAYHITYDNGTDELTFTQPAITRDANGAATNVPAMVVS